MAIELTDKIAPKNAAFADIVDAKNVGGDGTSANALQADAVATPAASRIVRVDSGNSYLEAIASVPVANGGTGATTLTGYVKGSGTSALTAAATVPGSDVSGNISGNAANVTGTVAVANGGTGQTTYTNGQLLIGNTTGGTLAKGTITAGSGITVTNGAGSITIAATGAGGSGDVVGPASATDNRVARFDGTTGKLIQNSLATVDDSGNLSTNGTIQSGGYIQSGGHIYSGGSGIVYGYGGVVAGGASGSFGLQINDPNSVYSTTIQVPTLTGNRSIILPTTAGSSGYFLRTDGSGNTSWALPSVGGGTYTDSTARSNAANTTEQDASSYTLAANTLSANGDWVKVRAAFEWAANGNTKNQSVYFAGTKVYDAGTAGTGGSKDYVDVTVVRTGTSTASWIGEVTSTVNTRTLPITGTLTGLTFTSSIIIKSTYQTGTAAAANITQRLFILDYGKGTV